MRSVLIGPVYPYRGGIAHYTTMLYRVLREQGHDVLLVSFKRQYPQWLFPGRSDRDPSKVPLEVEGAEYWIDSLNPFTWLTTFWCIRRYRPDAMILQWWTPFWTPVWFVLVTLNYLFLGSPVIYICHNVFPHEVHWYDHWLTWLVLRWGARFIVQSREEEARLLSLLPGAQATTVPLPVFDMFSRERISKEAARRQLGLLSEVPILLFFGVVRTYKGLEDLLAVLPEVQERLEKVILLVAGEFWEDKRPYLRMIEQLGIGDSVILEDRYISNEEIALYFSAADVLVAPYRQVTGSGVVQMAIGHQCPVITTAVGGLPDLIHDEENGLLVPPADSAALARAIIHYFADGLAASMARAARDRRPVADWHALIDAIESV